jgi:hypothetical protein
LAGLAGALGEPDKTLLWSGGLVVAIGFAFAIAIAVAWGVPGRGAERASAEEPAPAKRGAPDRSTCKEIAGSDLRSPAEGVWFEANCAAAGGLQAAPAAPTCNRTSLDPREFTEVAPGLFVFRQAYLWYASADDCFDLVSTRAVTAVCADRAVTFKWSREDPCAKHGSTLVRINGR